MHRLLSFGVVIVVLVLVCLGSASAQSAEADLPELTLPEAIEMALAHNLGLEGTLYQKQAAQWGMYNSIANYLPQASWNITYTRLDEESVDKANAGIESSREMAEQFGLDVGDVESVAWEDTYSHSISVIQPIFNGGAEIAAIRLARAARRQADFGYNESILATVRDTKLVYYRVMQAASLKRVAMDGLELSNETLRLFRGQYEVGQVSSSEVLRWEAQVAEAEGYLIEAESGYELAMIDLADILGRDLNDRYRLPEMNMEIDPQLFGMVREELLKLDEPGALDELIEEHPANRGANEAVRMQSASCQLAWATILPKLNFAYNYSWPTDDTIDLDGDESWTAIVQLEIPLFTGFRGFTQIVQERRNMRRARTEKRDFERTFGQQVYAAKLQIETAYRKLEAANKQVDFAGENLRNVEGKMEVGMASNLELLDAQVTYNGARADRVKAVSDYYIALSAWEYIIAQKY